MARVPVNRGLFEARAGHKRGYQRSGFQVYRTIDEARLVGRMAKSLRLKMQITVPNDNLKNPSRPPAGPPWPVLVFAHGGGFTHGAPGNPSPQNFARILATQGVICVNVAYRLTPSVAGRTWRKRKVSPWKEIVESHEFPAAVRDLKAAVRRARWEIAEGALKNVADPNRVGVCGTSAGATLISTVALTHGELEDTAEVRAANVQENRVGRRVTLDLLDLSDQSSAADFAAPIACPHPDLGKQLVVGKARKRTPGVLSYTGNGNEDLIRNASPQTHIGRVAPQFLFFHAQDDIVSPFLGIDSEAEDNLKLGGKGNRRLRNILRNRDFLRPGFQQELRADRSGLIPLGHVGHLGWKERATRRFIADQIGVFARGGLDAVSEARQPEARELPHGSGRSSRRRSALGV